MGGGASANLLDVGPLQSLTPHDIGNLVAAMGPNYEGILLLMSKPLPIYVVPSFSSHVFFFLFSFIRV